MQDLHNFSIDNFSRDSTWKFKNNKTFDISFFWGGLHKTPYTCIPDGIYEPKHLGLLLPEIDFISVGSCYWNKVIKRTHIWGPTEVAHATKSFSGTPSSVCFRTGEYLFSGPNTFDEVFLHEYAHIIDSSNRHGESWKERCRQLGIKYPRQVIDYTYNGKPENDFADLMEKGLIGGRLSYKGCKAAGKVVKKATWYDRFKPLFKITDFTSSSQKEEG